MVRFLVPGHLAEATFAASGPAMPQAMLLPDGAWPEVVQAIRRQCPDLAARVLTQTGTVAAGFALVVNDAVVQRNCESLCLRPGDELCIIATVAGG